MNGPIPAGGEAMPSISSLIMGTTEPEVTHLLTVEELRKLSVKELRALLALINEHIDNETRFCAPLDEHDDDSPEFAAKGGDDLSTRGIELIHAIAMHPATSFEAILLKGRYLAARRARGDLSYEVAFAFVESFLDRAEGV